MNSLEFPDHNHWEAAQGWLELGNHEESNVELDKVSEANRDHPLVLLLRWDIYRHAEKWADCLELGQTLTEQLPSHPLSWIKHAQSFYYMKRYQEAYDLLKPQAERFPGRFEVPYDLACYCCRLNNVSEAQTWLDKAFAMEKSNELKIVALNDPDLEPLWPNLDRDKIAT